MFFRARVSIIEGSQPFKKKEIVKLVQLPSQSRSTKNAKKLLDYLREKLIRLPEEKISHPVRGFLGQAVDEIKVHHFKKGQIIMSSKVAQSQK